MSYTVRFSTKADKEYAKLDGPIKQRIDKKLDYLRTTPRGPDTKKLAGFADSYRCRVGDYRIVFEIKDHDLIVWIIKIGHRRDVYE